MMTGSLCSSSSTKVVLVVPGFPSFFVHFSLSTYDCRLVQNYQLPSGSVKLWGFLHFDYRLQSYSSSSFVRHSPFPFPHMQQRKNKPSNLRVLNTIDIQRMPSGSQPNYNSSKKDDDDDEKQTILQQPRCVSSFTTAAAMEDHKKERSSSILDGWWSLC